MNHFCASCRSCLMFMRQSQLLPKIDNNEQQTPSTSQTRIKRPMNPFILWSSEKRKKIAKENPKLHNSEISKQLGEEWRTLPQEEKQTFIDRSNQLREEHKQRYPNYKYCPRKKTKSEDTSRSINPHCLMQFSPMAPFHYSSIQHHPQTSSQITYYSDTGPPSILMPANTATGPSTAFVSANTTDYWNNTEYYHLLQ